MHNHCELKNNAKIHILMAVRNVDINELIGKNLKRLRTERGLSLAQFAEKIEVAPQRISGIENGREPMGKGMMEKLCTVLNVRPWEFYFEFDTPIISDPEEAEVLARWRQARALNVSEDLAKYETYRIEDAKKNQDLHKLSQKEKIELLGKLSGRSQKKKESA